MQKITAFLGAAIVLGFMAFMPVAQAQEAESVALVDFEYIELEPLNLPIITSRGLTQQLSLMVSLEVDFGQKEALSLYKPRLTDAYLQDLYGALGAGHALMQNNIINVQQIKDRLTAVTDKVLGPDRKVRGVLLQVVQQRPL